MTPYTKEFYQLLPSIDRIRDEREDGQGGPLRALLEIIGEQAEAMDRDIAQLYDNWFIETCESWVVPYIGDLPGVRGLHGVGGATFNQRAQVANTLRYRSRKGTAAMLEQLADDATGDWNARAVEFFQRLGTTQCLNHLRAENLRTPNLRDGAAMELMDTPFDVTSRTVEVRSIASARGRYNLPNVGLFLWRLQAYPVWRAPAFDHGENRYSFSQLGHDIPLFNRPAEEEDADITHLAEERNVPGRLRRRSLYDELEARRQTPAGKPEPQPVWFGREPVVEVFLDNSNKSVPPEEILICHLGEWTVPPDKRKYQHVEPDGTLREVECPIRIAVDPELGRLMFPAGVATSKVDVSYAYGFSSELGGGFYDREHPPLAKGTVRIEVAKSSDCDTLQKAVDSWTAQGKPNAVVLIQDSEFYDETLDLQVPAGRTLEIRADLNSACVQQRPVLRLKSELKLAGALPDEKTAPATVILDGLWLTGNAVQVQAGSLGVLAFRHCTLVPGWGLNLDGSAASPGQPSITTTDSSNGHLVVTLDRCITGPLLLAGSEKLVVRDSIVTADSNTAIEANTLVVECSTIFGSVDAHEVELASDSIFTGPVVAARRQEGCVRFCSLPRSSQVPRRYRCQPNLAIEQAYEAAKAQGKAGLTAKQENAIELRLKPAFGSEHYDWPEFAQLLAAGPREILTGADDESEMGAFHHLRAPQREANLRASLDEYLRVGLEAGIFYVDFTDWKRGTTYERRSNQEHVQPREALQQRADATRPRAARRRVERATGHHRAPRGGRGG
jgi:hypothetical protein